jgi:LDH2 family malate/lactate/ureidoglycolate dehydrogenase
MKLAIAKCRDTGLAAVAVRNSGHFGAAGSYASIATRSGFVGFATTNTRRPAVVPTFGAEAMLGTNPVAFAAPAKRNRPFLLDMATSTVPVGKLMTAWRNGEPIPEGWAIDERGAPCTDPKLAVAQRRLTPLGGRPEMGSHKGYGLAAALEILCAQIPGTAPGAARRRIGHFFLALDPSRFRPDGSFESDLDDLLDSLRGCRPVDASTPVRVAGDPEYAASEERRVAGVPLTRAVVEDIRLVCRESGAPFLLDSRR